MLFDKIDKNFIKLDNELGLPPEMLFDKIPRDCQVELKLVRVAPRNVI